MNRANQFICYRSDAHLQYACPDRDDEGFDAHLSSLEVIVQTVRRLYAERSPIPISEKVISDYPEITREKLGGSRM